MGARILEFGSDYSNHHLVLTNAGYEVRPCGSSLDGLEDGLRNWNPDAVVLVDDIQAKLTSVALPIVRRHCSAPVIVFGAYEADFGQHQVQLVIPPLSNPSTWLADVARVLGESQALLRKSHVLREQSEKLRQQGEQLWNELTLDRERLNQLRENNKNK